MEAFKDAKVIIVLLGMCGAGVASSANLLLEVGELRADVKHMASLLDMTLEQCGASDILRPMIPTTPELPAPTIFGAE